MYLDDLIKERGTIKINTYNNKELTKAILHKLHDLGYEWCSSAYEEFEVGLLDILTVRNETILIYSNGISYWSNASFNAIDGCEISLNDLFSIKQLDTTITLSNGKKVELSKESYESILEAAKERNND